MAIDDTSFPFEDRSKSGNYRANARAIGTGYQPFASSNEQQQMETANQESTKHHD